MKKTIKGFLFVFFYLILSSCQSATQIPIPTQTSVPATTTPQPPTTTPEPTATLIPVPAEALAGLIISSPILGAQLEDPSFQPPEKFTVNGLGIINSKGQLVRFADAGLFESFSPSGRKIVYQHGYPNEFTDRIDNLYVYDSSTGKTTEIVDDLENEGGKTILTWSQDEQSFIYYNDYLTVLFEAYGYFDTRQLLQADVKTGQTKLLISAGYQFDVSPDQTQIAYTVGEILDSKTKTYGGQDLEKFGCFQPRMYDVATSSSKPFDLGQLEEKPVCVGYPKWSPDGTKLAWMGYFEDDTFRPIILDLQNNIGTIYAALEQKPESSLLPTEWFLGEPIDPFWVDHSVFWTPSYEVNIATVETVSPREVDLPYSVWSDEPLASPDRSLYVLLNKARDTLVLMDGQQIVLASYRLDDLYKGPQQEVLTSDLVLQGVTQIVGWSPFAPPPISDAN